MIEYIKYFLVPESCRNYYSEGHRSNGVYLLSGGEHYCLMEDVGCGSGGWTLAMKVKGDSVGCSR